MSDRRSRIQHARLDRDLRPVRFLITLALFAIIAACARPSAAACDVSVSSEVEFAGAPVDIRAETQGPNCHQAIALYTIRDQAGDLIYAWTTPLQRGFGDVFAAEPDEHLQSFLERWAQPFMSTTAAAPAWDELEVGQTTFDQLTYADIRARDLPMLCHYSGTSRESCMFWEPAAGAAGHFFDRAAEETSE